jgi:hypothetical protein
LLGEIRGGGPVWDTQFGCTVVVLVADCGWPKSRASLNIMMELFRAHPANDFFDHTTSTAILGSRPDPIGHTTLVVKCAGTRSAGNPPATCDVAGAGNGARGHLRPSAPVPDPTSSGRTVRRRPERCWSRPPHRLITPSRSSAPRPPTTRALWP